jgi:hypothetical protein
MDLLVIQIEKFAHYLAANSGEFLDRHTGLDWNADANAVA